MDARQILERLGRENAAGRKEDSTVICAGQGASAWAGKVKNCVAYNVYGVSIIEIGLPGTIPVETGSEMQAVNLAESFLQQGNLAAGTYIVMQRVGDKNVFWAKP